MVFTGEVIDAGNLDEPSSSMIRNSVSNQEEQKAAAAAPWKELLDSENPLLLSQAASEKGAVNQLEDMALTQTMFDEGHLIWQGDAEEFVNIIRKSRNSI